MQDVNPREARSRARASAAPTSFCKLGDVKPGEDGGDVKRCVIEHPTPNVQCPMTKDEGNVTLFTWKLDIQMSAEYIREI